MAKRASFLVVLLCVAIAGAVLPAPVAASRKLSRGMASFAIRAWCIPKTESVLEEHEGRHSCVYNLTNGDRAVGVGYNLDDDKETRRSEMSTVLADYDKVYISSMQLQINAFCLISVSLLLAGVSNVSISSLCPLHKNDIWRT
jgi:hypothetical protein